MSTTHTNTHDIVEATTKVLIKLQHDPGHGSADWPNITMQQLRVMVILYSKGPTRVSWLARRLGVSTPTITGILDRLVRHDLTYRADDPRDRRVVLNALTDKGRSVIEKVHAIDSARLSQAIRSLSPSQQQNIVSAMSTLAEAIESIQSSPD